MSIHVVNVKRVMLSLALHEIQVKQIKIPFDRALLNPEPVLAVVKSESSVLDSKCKSPVALTLR